MSAADLRVAIERPARVVGAHLQAGLVDLVLREVAALPPDSPGTLALVAHAMNITWRHRAARVLTIAGYERSGGIGGAVAATAEFVYEQFGAEDRETARVLLMRLVHIGDGTHDARRRLDRERLLATAPAAAARVLTALTDAGLLTTADTTVEIAHEALLRAWPRLRSWIDADRAGAVVHQALIEAAEVWERGGRQPGDLHTGTRLHAATDWLAGSNTRLDDRTARFLAASDKHAARQRDGSRRRTRRLLVLSAVLGVLLLLTTAAGYVAVVQWQRADALRAAEADARRSAANQVNARDALRDAVRLVDRASALNLALAAHRISPSPDTIGTLTALLRRHAPVDYTAPQPELELTAVGVSTGLGQVRAFGGDTVVVWPVGSHDPPARWTAPVPLADVALEADQPVAIGKDGTVWDTTRPSAAGPITRAVFPNKPDHPGVTADGRWLYTSSDAPDGPYPYRSVVQVWSLANRSAYLATYGGVFCFVPGNFPCRELPGVHNDRSRSLPAIPRPVLPVLSADGALAAISDGAEVTYSSLDDPAVPNTEALPHRGGVLEGVGPLRTMTMSADGTRLATSGVDGTVRVWDLTDPTPRLTTVIPDADLAGRDFRFSPDNRQLPQPAKGGVRVWYLDPGDVISQICTLSITTMGESTWKHYFPEEPYQRPCS
ncbi:hypothetical protein CLV40_11116 [Actinokineospora auranticolor]|uniref:Novel STAND NTPase 1 domain-containing protein n=2 Tax=Actinokineospora auranticolor TaxID=155976 RepID=A0A2S6GLE5_9PSEU|nr:hypothetical protein CLV40_11116 [Actinokineospora auranticolor]